MMAFKNDRYVLQRKGGEVFVAVTLNITDEINPLKDTSHPIS